MITKAADFFEAIGEELGVSVKLPRPDQETRNATARMNKIAGTSLILSGVLFKKKTLTILGVGCVANAFLLKKSQG
ncbi:hypothetical protein ABE869_00530 [Enterococcus gilvus]|uniref:hypothetical protein n=1 Tax=Enterococcus gilvus TaxID=160453 RepID=UPI003D6B4B89